MLQRLPARSGRQRKKLAQAARLWARGLLYIPPQDAPHDADAEFNEALAAMELAIEEPALAGAAVMAGSDVIAGHDPQSMPRADTCYLWLCNLPTWRLWHRLQTQWRVGMGGREGLDYGAVAVYMEKVACVRRKEFAKTFSAIQAMERACLDVWAEKRK